jgi:hypothetical protein
MALRVTKKEIQLILRFLTSPFCFSCPFTVAQGYSFSATALLTMWVLVSEVTCSLCIPQYSVFTQETAFAQETHSGISFAFAVLSP